MASGNGVRPKVSEFSAYLNSHEFSYYPEILDRVVADAKYAKKGVDLKLGRETLSLAFPRSGMRQAFRWRPAFTIALTASATI